VRDNPAVLLRQNVNSPQAVLPVVVSEVIGLRPRRIEQPMQRGDFLGGQRRTGDSP
jgi:hypothetical protein